MVKGPFTEYYYNKGEAEKAAMKWLRKGYKTKIETKKMTEIVAGTGKKGRGTTRKVTRYIVKKYKK